MKLETRLASVDSTKRLDGVDLLRGLATLFVLLNHVNMQLLFAHVPYTRGLPRQLVASLVWNGQYGVQMFFAISGFLITSTTLRRWGTLHAMRARVFYGLRFARIAPLLILILAVLSALHLRHVSHFVVSAKVGGLSAALFAALTFRINVLEASRGYLPGSWDILWSLSVEEMFYLFFPLVCKLPGRGKPLTVLLIGFVSMGPLARTLLSRGNPVWHEYSYLGAMDAIALGCLTALVIANAAASTKQRWALAIVGAALAGFILCGSVLPIAQGLERCGLDMTFLASGTCMMIAAAAQSRWRAPGLLAPLRWLGERSYEVYLTHMFMVVPVFTLFLLMGGRLRMVLLLFVVVIALSGLLGVVVGRAYSEPLNRLLRKRLEVDGRGMPVRETRLPKM